MARGATCEHGTLASTWRRDQALRAKQMRLATPAQPLSSGCAHQHGPDAPRRHLPAGPPVASNEAPDLRWQRRKEGRETSSWSVLHSSSTRPCGLPCWEGGGARSACLSGSNSLRLQPSANDLPCSRDKRGLCLPRADIFRGTHAEEVRSNPYGCHDQGGGHIMAVATLGWLHLAREGKLRRKEVSPPE